MGLFSRKKREWINDDDDTANDDSSDPDDELVEQEPDPRDEFDQLIEREFQRLASAGTIWTGAERLAIADDARRAQAGEEPSGLLPTPIEEATRRVAVDAAGIRGTDVAGWEAAGLDPFGFVEIIGIVSRLAAIDVTSFGLGRPLPSLPEAIDGQPSKEIADAAKITTGWAPTVGPASAPSALSALPAEHDAMFDLHGVLYASMDQMFDLQLSRNGLSRPQIELVAGRTSHLNECFY